MINFGSGYALTDKIINFGSGYGLVPDGTKP